VTPHPELLRVLGGILRALAQLGPEPVFMAARRIEVAAWLVRTRRQEQAANDSTWPPEQQDG